MRLPVRDLYRLARAANNADAILNPRRIPRRVKNIVLGRLLARTGVFGKMWGG
jgi:hypothetical protein